MSEDFEFERFFSTNKQVQPLLPNVEVQERVDTDERRITHEVYKGGLAQTSIEEAMIAAFKDRAEELLGYDPFAADEVKPEDLTFLAKSEGLECSYPTIRDLGAAAVKGRVALIVDREGLDLSLTVRDGLRAALIKRHTEQVKQERSGTS